ncbi:centromere DNA-binding protein complex CBF3 subunit, domain 2 domain-containing protein [Hirsutella rhossiliensis]
MEGKPACAPCNLHEWCQANWPAIPDVWPASVPQGQQLPGDLVDEGKLLLFMKEKGKRVADERKRHLEDQGSWNSQRCVCAGADTRPHQQIACALRTQVDFLLGNHMLLRSGNRLPMELADCFPLDLPNEGCKAQGYTTKALTNQHGRMEYGSALRHRDPRSCLIGALAFWLFWRWQVEKAERFPSSKEAKTGMKRRCSADRRKSLKTAREWTSRFYKKAGIKVSKVSHAPRVAATQNADMAGPPTPWPGLTRTIQIRRAGRWNNGDQMTGCYLTSLPFEFMRAVADFDPEWPPVVLLVQVWPQLDKWKEAHSSPFSDLGVEQNMAAGAFLELLEWLREVLLQDAVFLRESYPDHPIFQDPVFSCPEFEAFASKVQDTCTRDHEDSHTTVIQKAMPVVAEKLRTVLTQQVAAEQLAERRHLDLLGASYELCTKLDEFAQATYTVTFSPGQGAAGQHAEIAGAHQQRRRAPRETVLRSEIGPSQAGGPTYAPLSLEQQQGMVQAGQASPQGRAHGEPPGPREPPSFKLPELLRLWRQGWGEMPSVDSLERDWEKNYLSTRKIIVDEVRRRAQSDGLTEDIVARQMDEERGGPSSLDKLFKAIRKDRQGEKGTQTCRKVDGANDEDLGGESAPRPSGAASLQSAVVACRQENASNHRNLATDRMLSSRTGFLVVGPGFRALWRSEDDINPAEVIRTCDIHLISRAVVKASSVGGSRGGHGVGNAPRQILECMFDYS